MESLEDRPLAVLVIADQPGHIIAVQSFLSSYPGYVVRGVKSPEEALSLLANYTPDVVLLDLSFGLRTADPHFDRALRFLKQLRTDWPQITAAIFSTIGFLDTHGASAALRHGVSYLIKEELSTGEELHRAIQLACSGGVVYSEAVIPYLVTLVRDDEKPELTDRELRVAEGVARGLTNAEIAEELRIATTSVRDYVSNIMQKLGVRNRAAIGVWFVRRYPNGLPSSSDISR